MAIEFQTNTGGPGATLEFFFDDDVQSYVVGVTNFSFTYGSSTDHHVETTSLHLTTNKLSSRTIEVRIDAKLQDDSGDYISTKSKVEVVCLALTGTADSNVVFSNQQNISVQSGPIQIGTNNPPICVAALAGWDLCYEDGDDHHVKTWDATTGTTTSGEVVFITGSAEMKDDSSHVAAATVDGALIVSCEASPGFLVNSTNALQEADSQNISFDEEIESALVMIQNWTISYGSDDHHIKTYSAGCFGDITVDGSQVTLNKCGAYMSDNSDNSQDNDDSSVILLVIGIPKNGD